MYLRKEKQMNVFYVFLSLERKLVREREKTNILSVKA